MKLAIAMAFLLTACMAPTDDPPGNPLECRRISYMTYLCRDRGTGREFYKTYAGHGGYMLTPRR